MSTADRDTPARPRRQNKSLRARALAHLARREHSRAELARKLAPYAQSGAEVECLLDELTRSNLLSERRFAEALARARGRRFGSARVLQELRALGVEDDALRQALDMLTATEFERARALWQGRFGAPAADAAGRARQMRFLAQRGFTGDVIRRVVDGRSEED